MTDAGQIVAAVPHASLLVSADDRILAANAMCTPLFGEGIAGRHLITVIRQPSVLDAIEGCRHSRAAQDTRYLTNDGRQDVTYKVSCAHLDLVGLTGVLAVFEDVTHLEQVGQMRRDFVANVSHELRSPLTVLAGFLETLQGAAADDPQARTEFLSIMQAETERMTGLVADLLSLSRVEASARIRPREPVAIDMVLHATLAALRPQIEQAGLNVTCDLPDDLPPVPGDYDQLVQVYHNLVENALKYGADGGEIEITGVIVPRLPGLDGPALRLAIRDHGEGIDPIHIPRLTERFYRVDRARSRQSGGTGLGLAIVKHILGRHRGRLIIRSHPGEGSTFETILPLS